MQLYKTLGNTPIAGARVDKLRWAIKDGGMQHTGSWNYLQSSLGAASAGACLSHSSEPFQHGRLYVDQLIT